MNSGEVSPAHTAALAQILGAIPRVKGEQRQLCVASLLRTGHSAWVQIVLPHALKGFLPIQPSCNPSLQVNTKPWHIKKAMIYIDV